jgi:ribose transport system substrate-binding protein
MDTPETNTDVKPLQVAILCKSAHLYWVDVETGAKAAAEKFDVKLIFERPIRETADRTIKRINELADMGVDGIGVSTSFAVELSPEIRRIMQKGVPVFTIDTDVPDSGRLLYVGTNNKIAGRIAGDTLAKGIRFRGQIAIMTGSLTARNAVDRMDGFNGAMARYPNVKVVAVEDDGENATRAFLSAKNLLTKHPDINGFYGVFSSDGPAIARAVKMSNREGIHIVCFDVLKETVEFIREGIIDATIGQRPYNIGFRTVELFTQIKRHGVQHVAHSTSQGGVVDTGIDIITRDSLDRYTQFLQRMGLPIRF